MSGQKLENWIAENGTGSRERKYFNGIEYLFAPMNDAWIAVFECDNGRYIPVFQAADVEHAISRCSMTERITVPFNVI